MKFNSAADAYGHRVVGIILTGANADGANGLSRISELGGLAIIQDPKTAESPTMPAAAQQSVPRARVMPLARMGEYVGSLPSGNPERVDA